jgi:peptidoglycan/LPS O-acetylase OafA/YrhL
MNLHYHWLTEGLELLSFFLFSPALAIVVAYKGWRERANPKRYGMRCVASGGAAVALICVAKWINADTAPLYLLQCACFVLGLLLLGVCEGYFFSVLLGIWRWHKSTRAL